MTEEPIAIATKVQHRSYPIVNGIGNSRSCIRCSCADGKLVYTGTAATVSGVPSWVIIPVDQCSVIGHGEYADAAVEDTKCFPYPRKAKPPAAVNGVPSYTVGSHGHQVVPAAVVLAYSAITGNPATIQSNPGNQSCLAVCYPADVGRNVCAKAQAP